MKIAVFEVEDWERQAFEKLQKNHEVTFQTEKLTKDNAALVADADIVSVFVHSDLDRNVIGQFKHLKLIATRSTGFDHIDTGYCRERNICVFNVPSYGENTVAEHVFGLLLTISHNLCEAIDRTRKGEFSQAGLQGFDLKGKTMGVIGTGNIGMNVIRIAKGFGMHVVAFDVQPDKLAEEKLGFFYTGMDNVLSTSDVVTLHVPANENTYHLISREEFGKMKKGVVFINTARGSVVDIHALLRSLAEGRVAAAGLDVLPEEPVIREEAELLHAVFHKEHNLQTLLVDHILLRMRNVYITPHSAFNTREAVERILDVTVNNINDFIRNKRENVVISCA